MNCCRDISCIAALLLIPALGCEDESTPVSDQLYSERSEDSFAVGDSSTLEVNNFAGSVHVKPGDPGVMDIAATKWAGSPEHLDEIEVEMVELQNGVRVSTANPLSLSKVSVNLESTVPPDARPTVQVAAGNVDYEGRAEGECHFAVAAGGITVRLPDDVNVVVSLSVGAGTIRVDFPVDGQVSDHIVDGIIGTGVDGRIEAQVGAGRIDVLRQ